MLNISLNRIRNGMPPSGRISSGPAAGCRYGPFGSDVGPQTQRFMPIVGAASGSFVGLLVAGALHKLLPEHELGLVFALIIAVSCLVGAALEWQANFGDKER